MQLRYWFITTLLPLSLIGRPSGPEVTHGSATFTHPTTSKMEIFTSDQAIIHWESFSIGEEELAKFTQPSSTSAVLNRVTSQEPSALMGTLEANGKVILLNENGIVVGPNGTINTNGFLASTLDLLDSEFLQGGDLRFQGNSDKGIINLGTIKALEGDVALIGRYVRNEGRIEAHKGLGACAVGREILLKPEGNERIYICALSQSETQKGVGIQQSGTIEALKVRLYADGNPYKVAINHEGKIDALTIHEQNGDVYLLAPVGKTIVNGTLRADQGEIRVLGKEVHLMESADLDVSSAIRTGQIFVGGSFQGKNKEILNSELTFIHQDAVIKASSIDGGDGGLVVVWSDGSTQFHGTIYADGGKAQGNGGTVEVSGKFHLDKDGGMAYRNAPAGTPGKLLLDPSTIRIAQESTEGISFGYAHAYSPTSGISTLSVKDLISSLERGPVEILTTSAFGGDGDIIFESDVTALEGYNTSNPLTLTCDRDLIIHSNVQNDNNGSITCNVGRDLKLDGSNAPASLGVRLGSLSVKTGRHLHIAGGKGGPAQVGTDMLKVENTIHLDIGGDLIVQAEEHFAMIGNTTTSKEFASHSLKGDIHIERVGRNLLVTSNGKETAFAQIGHSIDQKNNDKSNPTTVEGNIQINNVSGSITLLGNGGEKGAYVLIGHGGRARSFNDTFSGSIDISTQGPIKVIGGQSPAEERFVGIGFGQEFATPNISHTVNFSNISVHSESDIILEGGQSRNPAFIGVFSGNKNTNTQVPGSVEKLSVSAGGNLILRGHEAGSVIGVAGINKPAYANIDISAEQGIFVDESSMIRTTNGESGGNLTLKTAGDLTLDGKVKNGEGALTLISEGATFLGPGSYVKNLSEDGVKISVLHQDTLPSGPNKTVSIQVTDEETSFSLRAHQVIAPGAKGLIMERGAAIETGGEIQIFSPTQEVNRIEGTLNGEMFSRGLPYLNTSIETWATSPLSLQSSDSPFQLFYQDLLTLFLPPKPEPVIFVPIAIPLPPPALVAANLTSPIPSPPSAPASPHFVLTYPLVERSQVVISELLEKFHGFDMRSDSFATRYRRHTQKVQEDRMSSMQAASNLMYQIKIPNHSFNLPKLKTSTKENAS